MKHRAQAVFFAREHFFEFQFIKANQGGVPGFFQFGFGGFAFPLYSLCIAHANDVVEPDDRIDVSSGLLLIFGIGAVIGPFAASWVMTAASHRALFLYTAGVHALTAVFALYRSRQTTALPPEDRMDFVGVAPSSPTVFEIDPRTPDLQAPPAASSEPANPEATP